MRPNEEQPELPLLAPSTSCAKSGCEIIFAWHARKPRELEQPCAMGGSRKSYLPGGWERRLGLAATLVSILI
jgi:hypothetical protein